MHPMPGTPHASQRLSTFYIIFMFMFMLWLCLFLVLYLSFVLMLMWMFIIYLEYSMTIFTQCTLFYMAQHDIQSFDLVPACNQPHATLLRRILLVRFTMMYSYPGVLKLYISFCTKY